MIYPLKQAYLSLKRSSKIRLYFYLFTFSVAHLLLLFLLKGEHHSISDRMCRWDCRWYLKISKYGYLPYPDFRTSWNGFEGRWAFFPLFPLITRGITNTTPLGFIEASLVLNFSLFPIITLLVVKYLEQKIGKISYLWVTAFCFSYPFNFWYFAPLTESLYATLLMLLLLGVTRGATVISAICAFFISLTRPTGFITSCLIALASMIHFKDCGEAVQITPLKNQKYQCLALMIIVCAGAGLAIYIDYLYYLVGDGLAFKHVEIAWGRYGVHSLLDFHNLITERPKLILPTIITIVIILSMALSRRWWLEMEVLAFPVIAALVSGNMQSITRYVFGNPLMMGFLASYFFKIPTKIRAILTIILVIIEAYLTYRWMHRHGGILT